MRTRVVASKSLKRARLAAAVGLCLGSVADAATIIVTDASEGSVVGQCTLQDAVKAVNTQAAVNTCAAGDGSNDVIDLTGFATPTTITFTSAPDGNNALALTKAVALTGNLNGSVPLVTIARSSTVGTPDFRLIYAGSDLSVHNLALVGGSATGDGGAILGNTFSVISVTNSVVSGNKATGKGGGVSAVIGNYLTFTNATISGNTAGGDGGGVYDVISNHFSVANSVISGNTAAGKGGGIATNNGNITLAGATVTGNSAASGGGVYSTAGHVAMYYSTLSGNSAGGVGGGIGTNNGPITLGHSSVALNTAGGAGGGARTAAGTVDVSNSTLNGNSAGTDGGAIYAGPVQTTTVINSTISGNTATNKGGGVFAFSPDLTFATVYANRVTAPSGKGAGIYFMNSATAYASIIMGNIGTDLDATSTITLGGHYNIIANSGVPVPADTQNCDVKLGPLANFGGWTKVLPLRTNSCAIDAVPFTATPKATIDQRDEVRPVQLTAAVARADVGAFEKQTSEDPDYIFIDGFGARASE